jgi:branched-subunit amino acid transport protein
MSWTALLAIAAGIYGFKVLGTIVIGGRTLPDRLNDCLDLLPVGLLSALIAVNTFTDGRSLVIDERLVGLLVALGCAWRKAPFVLTVVAASAAVAVIRL